MNLTKPEVLEELAGVCGFTGDSAFYNFEKKLRRVQSKRWKDFAFLLQTARFFGCKILFSHKSDKPSTDRRLGKSAVLDPVNEYTDDCVGVFLLYGEIELTLCRLPTWRLLENVLRHELTHLLQQAGGETLLSLHIEGGESLAKWAEAVAPRAVKFDNDPCEAEAYWLMSKPKRWQRWAETFKDSECWSGWTVERQW